MNKYPLIAVGAILIVAFLLLGESAVLAVIVFGALFALPGFLAINSPALDLEEKLILGTLLGAGLFGLLVYYVNAYLIPSLRISAIVALAALCAVFIIKKPKA